MGRSRRERLKSIRSVLDEASEPLRGLERHTGNSLVISGGKNFVTHKVVYQFGVEPALTGVKKVVKPQIDWTKAPKGARWWAVDANGHAHWFCAPNVAAFTDFWYSEPLLAPDFGFEGDWRESLTERPTGG